MTPEPTPHILEKAESVQSESAADRRNKRVVAIQASVLLFKSLGFYMKAINELAKGCKLDEAGKAMISLLESPNGFLALICIYLHSPAVSDAERDALKQELSSSLEGDRPTTRNSIATTIKDVLPNGDTHEALRVNASRIVAAAMHFGLAVEDAAVARTNFKPLRGTARLDDLMIQAGVPAAILMRDALANRAE